MQQVIVPDLPIITKPPNPKKNDESTSQKDNSLRQQRLTRDRVIMSFKPILNNTFYKVALRWAPLDNSLEKTIIYTTWYCFSGYSNCYFSCVFSSFTVLDVTIESAHQVC